jgi:hypothetical protein
MENPEKPQAPQVKLVVDCPVCLTKRANWWTNGEDLFCGSCKTKLDPKTPMENWAGPLEATK